MTLQPGFRLGSYEIVSSIGAGGMGEVYRAHDPALHRDVALKVLPAAVADDPDRLARFEREARALAALNHPNIAQIYGLERSSDTPVIVMELVEGEDLSERIARDAVPLADALPVARQIARALEAAHERGLVHRDLKPANIKVRDDGTVKVLDFGLAKAMEPPGEPQADLANSPTLTARATQLGVILGTAAYMAPEQVKGKPIDKRVDVWAFGVVLYEMLAGRRPFDGDDVTEVMARVIEREPEWSALPVDLPSCIHRLLRRCLVKERTNRLHDIADARLEIDAAGHEADDAAVETTSATAPPAWPWAVAGLAVGGLAVGLTGWAIGADRSVTTDPLSRFPIVLDEAHQPVGPGRALALSQDGGTLVYRAHGVEPDEGTWLYRRSLDGLTSQRFPGTQDAALLAVSPHGDQVLLSVPDADASHRLMRTQLGEGGPVHIAELPAGVAVTSASWFDGTVVLGGGSAGLLLVRPFDATGELERIVAPSDGERYVEPNILPGGRAVLFTSLRFSWGSLVGEDVKLLELENGNVRTLMSDARSVRYVPGGHVVFLRKGVLRASRFDVERLQIDPESRILDPQIRVDVSGNSARLAVSAGLMAFVPDAGDPGSRRELVWMDALGNVEPLPLDPRPYSRPRVSPDGTHVAVGVQDGERDVYVIDLLRPSQLRRLTFDPAVDRNPVWLRSDAIAFTHHASGTFLPYRLPAGADAAVEPERLLEGPQPSQTLDASRDGRFVLLGGAEQDLVLLDLDGGRTPVPFVHSPFLEDDPRLSPDGRWIAYESLDSGVREVYVRPFGREGERQLLSLNGGQDPAWAGNGRTVFYRRATDIMSVSIDGLNDERLDVGRPSIVVPDSGMHLDLFPNFDVAQAGPYEGRLLVVRSLPPSLPVTDPDIVVVLNLRERLRQLFAEN